MKARKIGAVILVFALLFATLCGCSPDYDRTTEKLLKKSKSMTFDNNLDFVEDEDRTSVAYQLIRSMSIKDKIGQLLIIEPDKLLSSETNNTYSVTQYMRTQYEKYPVAGFILMHDNIKDPSQLNYLTKELLTIGSIKSFIGVEEEGGEHLRIAGTNAFNIKKTPSMKDLAASENPEAAVREATAEISKYLFKYNINFDLAPVADVLTAKSGSIIGSRSFGSDPKKAAQLVTEAIKGLHDHQTMAAVKHFPGHGSVSGDSNIQFIDINKTWEEMLECEIVPFKAAVKAGADIIVVSHLTAQKVTGDDLPSSLSYEIMTKKLRQELGFNGVIMTESFSADVIASTYTPGTAAVTAIKAGADIVALSDSHKEAFNGILKALTEGTLSMKRINESVWRVLKLKEEYGLLQ
ncbi:MAG: glycoside hydrolase family 3 protein [Clostridia bacterium]|nr:glycoside hydrolase family 3 protein [Clostridia bacterium]